MDYNNGYTKDINLIVKSLERTREKSLDKTYISVLYKELKEAFTYVRRAKCSKLHRVTGREYHRVPSGSYFPRHLNEKAFSHNVIQIMCSCEIAGRKIEIRFGIPKETNPTLDKLATYVQCIMAIIYFCGKYSKRECSKTLDIMIILLDDVKTLPFSANSTIGAPHINSGFSYVCQSNNQLVVYRSEEWFKVFIHEAFHAFGLEGILSLGHTSAGVRKLYDVESTMSLGEAYVETWARLLNASTASFIRSKNYKKFSENLCMSLMIDGKFSAMQASKALDFMGLHYNAVCKSKNAHARILYREDTNLFSYYVLGGVLMCNIELFLKWCARNNSSWIRFGDTDNDVTKFTSFIIDIHRNNTTLEAFAIIDKSPSHPGMRMSFIDLM